MSRNARPHYRPGLGWILGFAFEDTLARPVRLAQEFTLVRCHGSPRASSPHGLTATRYGRLTTAPSRAVASGSRLLPTRPAKDFHLQSSAHARHTSSRHGKYRLPLLDERPRRLLEIVAVLSLPLHRVHPSLIALRALQTKLVDEVFRCTNG